MSVATPLKAAEIPAPPPPPPGGPTNLWSLMNAPVSRNYFIASLYSDGDIHSYGDHAPYLYNAHSTRLPPERVPQWAVC